MFDYIENNNFIACNDCYDMDTVTKELENSFIYYSKIATGCINALYYYKYLNKFSLGRAIEVMKYGSVNDLLPVLNELVEKNVIIRYSVYENTDNEMFVYSLSPAAILYYRDVYGYKYPYIRYDDDIQDKQHFDEPLSSIMQLLILNQYHISMLYHNKVSITNSVYLDTFCIKGNNGTIRSMIRLKYKPNFIHSRKAKDIGMTLFAIVPDKSNLHQSFLVDLLFTYSFIKDSTKIKGFAILVICDTQKTMEDLTIYLRTFSQLSRIKIYFTLEKDTVNNPLDCIFSADETTADKIMFSGIRLSECLTT